MLQDGKTVRVGARASNLSKVQVQEVLDALHAEGKKVSFLHHWVETKGDKDLQSSLRDLEKTDFFTKELDDLLVQGSVDITVNSAKDLPEPLPPGIEMVALTRGVDSADVLVFRHGESLDSLPATCRVGVSSDRREKAVKILRPEAICTDIRGTIERRLEQLDKGAFDAVAMAKAALLRLQMLDRPFCLLKGELSPLQGQLAVLARSGDNEMQTLFSCIDVRVPLLNL